MTIERSTVRHIARLAHLELEDDEVEAFRTDLDRIVQYVEKLSELETSSVQPTAHVSVTEAPLREDRTVTGLATALALGEGPRTQPGGFAVPAFVDEG